MNNFSPILSYLALLLFLGHVTNSIANKNPIDSIRALIQSEKENETTIDLYFTLSEEYDAIGELDSAIHVVKLAKEAADRLSLVIKQAEANYYIGYYHDINGNLTEALNYYEAARQLYQELDIKEEVATCINSKGVAAYLKGDFEMAMEFLLESLSYCELNEIDRVALNTLVNLGVVYRITNKNEQAIQTYRKTVRLSEELNEISMTAVSHHNLGVAFTFSKELDSALHHFNIALKMYEELNAPLDIGWALTGIGEAYYLTGTDNKKAREYLLQGLDQLIKVSDESGIPKVYLLLGQVERDERHFNQSVDYFNTGLELVRNSDREDLLLDFYREMDSLFVLMNDYPNAYNSLNQYVGLYRKNQNSAKLKAIEELQTQYETKEKEQEIALLNSRNQLVQTRLRNTRSWILMLGLGVLILSILLYRLNLLKKKVDQSNAEKEILLKEIHHRVKNNLQVISALLSLQSNYIQDEKAHDALLKGQNRVESMALIHKNLYQHDNLKGVETKDYFGRLVEHLVSSYQAGEKTVELKLDIESLRLDVDTMIPLGLIVNELISNSLKHAFNNQHSGMIRISLKERDNTLQLSVEDNGQGIVIGKNSEGKSFGQSLIRSLTRRLDGEVSIDTTSGYRVDLEIRRYQKSA